MALVKKEMTLGEIIEKYPDTAEVMASYGLHCIGCHLNSYETLEQGAKAHGMSDKDLEKMLKDVNKAAEKTPKKKAKARGDVKITLTKKAADQLKEVMKKEDKEGYGIRVAVIPGGCSGYTYSMDFDKKANRDDKTFEFYGLKIFVNKKNLEMLDGTEIDYVENLQESGFKFSNPNTEASCGCGESFK